MNQTVRTFYIGFYNDCLKGNPSFKNGKRDFGWVRDRNSIGKMRGMKGKIKIVWVDQFTHLPEIQSIYEQVCVMRSMEEVEEIVVLTNS